MRMQYSYTMPESFIKDQSVPARWRLLGVINGFLINGKPFYGSNQWLMEQLGCSEQTVSNAVSELEALGEILCERTRRSRVITRKLRDPNQLGSETQTDSVRDPNQLGTNSVINSNILNESKDSLVEEVPEEKEERKQTTKKVTPEMREVFDLFSDNPARFVWKARVLEREAAAVLHREFGIEELRKRYAVVKKHRGEEMCPEITSPSTFLEKMPKMENFLKRL